MSTEKELSFRDLSILDLIFDQNKGDDDKINECTKMQDDVTDLKDDDEENSEEILRSKSIEIEAVKLAESEKFDDALNLFNKAIEITPNRPSLYNNRAQLYRFIGNEKKAIDDLEKAINLAGDKYKLTKCRAYCQRGIIKRKENDIDGAADDFNESAKLGSKFARQQLVEINPYRQLCNTMVSKILTEYQNY